ncbi:hypothetical protein Bhyg_09998 [Pseudolycoriella hygida]|uniref:Uncharacterized protein n=1 Tax=Pseudolycoriella hygida TaxID=35572 RepID=A0A9Q0MSM2_9DIPT|nr:hypothetical protein Bhyg_09998 [Pseudolycoriella hygida]
MIQQNKTPSPCLQTLPCDSNKSFGDCPCTLNMFCSINVILVAADCLSAPTKLKVNSGVRIRIKRCNIMVKYTNMFYNIGDNTKYETGLVVPKMGRNRDVQTLFGPTPSFQQAIHPGGPYNSKSRKMKHELQQIDITSSKNYSGTESLTEFSLKLKKTFLAILFSRIVLDTLFLLFLVKKIKSHQNIRYEHAHNTTPTRVQKRQSSRKKCQNYGNENGCKIMIMRSKGHVYNEVRSLELQNKQVKFQMSAVLTATSAPSVKKKFDFGEMFEFEYGSQDEIHEILQIEASSFFDINFVLQLLSKQKVAGIASAASPGMSVSPKRSLRSDPRKPWHTFQSSAVQCLSLQIILSRRGSSLRFSGRLIRFLIGAPQPLVATSFSHFGHVQSMLILADLLEPNTSTSGAFTNKNWVGSSGSPSNAFIKPVFVKLCTSNTEPSIASSSNDSYK